MGVPILYTTLPDESVHGGPDITYRVSRLFAPDFAVAFVCTWSYLSRLFAPGRLSRLFAPGSQSVVCEVLSQKKILSRLFAPGLTCRVCLHPVSGKSCRVC